MNQSENNIAEKNKEHINMIIIKSGCCNKLSASIEENFKSSIDQAIHETGSYVKITEVKAHFGMLENIGKKISSEIFEFIKIGKPFLPIVMINGEVISYGVPTYELIKNSLIKNNNKF